MQTRYVVALTLAAGLIAGCVGGYAIAAQPHMSAALADLQSAKAELQAAEHNKGGHRVKALEYVNSAIAETQLGIEAGE
jgi:hypothetical protein